MEVFSQTNIYLTVYVVKYIYSKIRFKAKQIFQTNVLRICVQIF